MVHRNQSKISKRPERLFELKLGGRVLRAGDVIKITGERGEFRITSFTTDESTVNVRGGYGGRRLDRAFFVDRIGTRKALAGSAKAEVWR